MGATPIKERVIPLRRFHELATAHASEIANTVAIESGKTPAEALAGLQRGLEVVDYALSLPNLDDGAALEVSRGVTCEARREPLGVVAGITPFNFPAMVPMWMFPIAMTLGNAFVLKPSEKVPLDRVPHRRADDRGGVRPGPLLGRSRRSRDRPRARRPSRRSRRGLRRLDGGRARRLPPRDGAGETRALPRRSEEPPHRRRPTRTRR